MEDHTVFDWRDYEATGAAIFNAIRDGTLFKRTGADKIDFDFREGGAFLLIFTGRGEISGTFDKIIANEKIVLLWDVTGFDRPPEIKTRVVILISTKDKTRLSIEHTEIKDAVAAAAKRKAWAEILDDLQQLK